MDSKKYITNRAFCPLAWTGIYVDAGGDVRNCIRKTNHQLGSLRDNSIHEILSSDKANDIRTRMLKGEKEPTCECCYKLEEGKKSFDIISDRIYYLKELKNVPFDTYEDPKNFDLRKIDVRWSNQCNFACVYCGPMYSNKWAKEVKLPIKALDSKGERLTEVKEYILENIEQLENVYFAGGEPLLMKQNEEIIQALWERNRNVQIRVNTNLSKTGTPIFDLLCKFPNVHWILSVESTDDEYEYIRTGGTWSDFVENLSVLQKLDHKISFNMLWCLFNPWSLFTTIDHFQSLGFQNNSYIIGPIETPVWQDVRQFNKLTRDKLAKELEKRIQEKPGYLLEDGYHNLLKHIKSPFTRDTDYVLKESNDMDQRRNLDAKKIFPEVFQCLRD